MTILKIILLCNIVFLIRDCFLQTFKKSGGADAHSAGKFPYSGRAEAVGSALIFLHLLWADGSLKHRSELPLCESEQEAHLLQACSYMYINHMWFFIIYTSFCCGHITPSML